MVGRRVHQNVLARWAQGTPNELSFVIIVGEGEKKKSAQGLLQSAVGRWMQGDQSRVSDDKVKSGGYSVERTVFCHSETMVSRSSMVMPAYLLNMPCPRRRRQVTN